MSVLTAIFQAILQAISFVMPTSELGHIALFNSFAGREQDTCSVLNGAIHIGIAIGILVAMYKPFMSIMKELVLTVTQIINNRQGLKHATPQRKFMYMTFLSLFPLFLWLIPIGKEANLYMLLSSLNFDGSIFSEGLFFIITGVLVFVSYVKIDQNRNKDKQGNVSVICAILFGVVTLVTVPVAGLSYVVIAMLILALFNVSTKISFRYTFVVAVPLLISIGIGDIITSLNSEKIVPTIVGLVLSAIIGFVAVKFCRYIYLKNKIEPFALYNVALGLIATVIGVFQTALR